MTRVTEIKQAPAESLLLSASGGATPQGVELRHLRYFVALADAGTFTHAAERMYVAQPTLSQLIRNGDLPWGLQQILVDIATESFFGD